MHLDEAAPTTFLPNFCFYMANYENLNVFLDLYPIDLNNQGQNTTAFSHKKPDKKSLKAYITEPAALQASRQIQVGRHDVTLSGLAAGHLLKMAAADAEILGFFGD